MYFIPTLSKNCTNSHGQRLPHPIRCTSSAEDARAANSTAGLTLGEQHGFAKLQKEYTNGHPSAKIARSRHVFKILSETAPRAKMLLIHRLVIRSKEEKQ